MKKHIIILIALISFILISGCKANEKNTAIHPAFSITTAELSDLTKDLPLKIRENIMEKPQYFLELTDKILKLPIDIFKLVDKKHLLPENYTPEDLASLNNYPVVVNRNDLSLRKLIMPDTLAMTEAAKNESITLVFSSTYRSYKYQDALYKRNVNRYGKETADRESAKPGASQHQLGTTIDFGSITDDFAYTPAGKWLSKHAWEYGFSLSYPNGYEELTGYRYECWHFRYLTRIGTLIEKDFFEGIQQYFLEFLFDKRETLIKYYIQSTTRQ